MSGEDASARGLLLLAAALVVPSCSSEPSGAAASSTSAAAVSASASSTGRAVDSSVVAMCDAATPSDHVCFEISDTELADERRSACAGRFARGEACPRADVVGVCRLPDGSLRLGYPPRSVTNHEKACRELQGRFAAGAAPPPADPVVVVRCEGKYPSACEEETVHTATRATTVQQECHDFGGSFKSGEGCDRTTAAFLCDLPGKRTIVSRLATTREAAERFCAERSARYIDLAPAPAASASASAGASAAPVDLDPPEAKGDVVIRQQ